MRKKNSYSRLVQNLHPWQNHQKGVRIQLFHHCVENKITSFFLDLNEVDEFSKHLGTALSESGLSRDKIQLIGRLGKGKTSKDEVIEGVENLLLMLRTDYLDLLLLDAQAATDDTFSALDLLKSRGQITETGSINGKTSGKHRVLANMWVLDLSIGKSGNSDLGELTSEDVAQFLFLKDLQWEERQEIKQLEEKYNAIFQELIFAWILNHPAHFHLITSGRQQEEIDLPARALNTQLIGEDREKISEIIRINISND